MKFLAFALPFHRLLPEMPTKNNNNNKKKRKQKIKQKETRKPQINKESGIRLWWMKIEM